MKKQNVYTPRTIVILNHKIRTIEDLQIGHVLYVAKDISLAIGVNWSGGTTKLRNYKNGNALLLRTITTSYGLKSTHMLTCDGVRVLLSSLRKREEVSVFLKEFNACTTYSNRNLFKLDHRSTPSISIGEEPQKMHQCPPGPPSLAWEESMKKPVPFVPYPNPKEDPIWETMRKKNEQQSTKYIVPCPSKPANTVNVPISLFLIILLGQLLVAIGEVANLIARY